MVVVWSSVACLGLVVVLRWCCCCAVVSLGRAVCVGVVMVVGAAVVVWCCDVLACGACAAVVRSVLSCLVGAFELC